VTLPKRVRIVEVGPRDGLQDEAKILSADAKSEFIELLAGAGLVSIEAGSFVPEKSVPQMATTPEVLQRLGAHGDLRLSVLVPNLHGLMAAQGAGAKEISIFASASETFSQRNINCSISDSLSRYAKVAEEAERSGLRVRGYVSCALGCPYEGAVSPRHVVWLAGELRAIGCDEISVADTIGVGTPLVARRLIEEVAREIGMERVAIHFHDAYGQALVNVFACLEAGVATVDASVAGLGGCPFAPGAGGNLATEDLVYMLDGMEVETGVDLDALLKAASYICARLDRIPASSVARAMGARQKA
jgi:hydroxymethylglutaryl-CoA lyase